MGKIHIWDRDARATVDGVMSLLPEKYFLQLRADDDEDALTGFWAEQPSQPEFIVAPDMIDSRTNSVVASNVRRILGDKVPIAVMVRGKVRRERMDMTHWLVENEYLPMFPWFMPNEATPEVPLTRHQTLHEARAILDQEPDWIFVLYGFNKVFESAAMKYIESTDNTWELLP